MGMIGFPVFSDAVILRKLCKISQILPTDIDVEEIEVFS
jgi:hypothetical protein